jgi:chitodextrinase
MYWEFPDSLNSQIQQLEVRRSAEPDGPFVLIPDGTLGSASRSFIDPSPLPSNYYQIVAIHRDNYELSAQPALGQMQDATPPAVPTGLSGSVSNSGTVTLRWAANAELDVRGYRVFSANGANATFVEVSQGVISTAGFSQQIELQTLSESIYYRISALDFHENESPVGPVLELKRPDVVPPSSPVLAKVEPSNAGISLNWEPSSSTDVVRHLIERKPTGSSAWEKVWEQSGTLNGSQNWQDTNLVMVAEWDYRVVAYDDAGLFSSSKLLNTKATTVKRPRPSNGKAEIASSNNQLAVKLLWEYPQNVKPLDMLIYRSKDNANLTLYATLPIEENPPVTTLTGQKALYVFRDKEVKAGSDYKYQIVLRFTDGIRSPATPEIPVSLK